MIRSLVFSLLLLLTWQIVWAQIAFCQSTVETIHTEVADQNTEDLTQLANQIRRSIVTVTHLGRDGKEQGMGTGFLVDQSGIIATNHHVIGEARPIQIRFSDNSVADVLSVFAHDEQADLALLKIAAETLPQPTPKPLKLSSQEQLRQGNFAAAMGHPQGLKNTLVTGIVAGYQEIDGRKLIQVSMPIDHGNSGGPLVNAEGEVVGIITYKSSTMANVGFAMPVKELKKIWETPNPIQMQSWITIGKLNPLHWDEAGGANWRRRAGQIHVSGTGTGFGGRSLLIWKSAPQPAKKFEVTVNVKLQEESGAAGLIFRSDGGDKHYGFYPSAGQLRLSRFDGADVFRWRVLAEQKTQHYRPGEWNRLKVSVRGSQIRCYCNEELVFDFQDQVYLSGNVGLAKFRDTVAYFKQFSVAEQLPSRELSRDLVTQLTELLNESAGTELSDPSVIEKLVIYPDSLSDHLEKEARQLELRIVQLRQLSQRVREQRVLAEISEELQNEEPYLARLCLLLAKYDNPDVDVDAYLGALKQMSAELKEQLGETDNSELELRKRLDDYLFIENGFHGSRTQYYHKSNSYLTDVIDDREGLPITLSVIYMILGQEIGLDIRGIGLPGHFVTSQFIDNQPVSYIDVFRRGEEFPQQEIEQIEILARVQQIPSPLKPQSSRQILARMVRNLKGIAESNKNYGDILRYLHLLVAIDVDNQVEHRYLRALVLIREGYQEAAWDDLAWLESHATDDLGAERLLELRKFAERRLN